MLRHVGRSLPVYKHVLELPRRCMCQTMESVQDSVGTPVVKPSQNLSGVSIDTLSICKKFKQAGFTDLEAEALTEVVFDVVRASIDSQGKMMVTKSGLEIKSQQLLAQISAVQKDMIILEKSEFTMIRNETEKQGIHIKQLEGKLTDTIKRLEGQVKLDINLERSRATEAHALNEKNLQSLHNKIEVLMALNEKNQQSLNNKIEVQEAQTEKNLKSLDNKIDVEISNMKTRQEKSRNTAIYSFIGFLTTGASLYFAYLRLLK
ncbi:coiled-coil domain-containing protein 90B, mitochondrial-like [Dreissena polymorpha]|nr:coiled-coil domain-containing protein 90B, mitochondrial-like [Dreissena polymorpha]